MKNTKEMFSTIRALPVVVIKELDDTIPTLKALCEGELPAAEITFRTACAADAIRMGVKEFPDMYIGAGTVINGEQAKAAKAMIDAIVFEPEVGAVYTGTVTGIKEFGCFVEYAPGKEGMVHISKIAQKRIEKVEDVLKLGDTVKIKYMGLDKKGRMDFSIKDAE